MEQNSDYTNSLNSLFDHDFSEIYSKVLNYLTDGIFITDEYDNIIFSNSSLKLVLDNVKINFDGLNILQFFEKKDYKEIIEVYNKSKRNLITENNVYKLNTDSDSSISINYFFIPIIINKEYRGIIGIVKNITRKTKEEKDFIISHSVLRNAEILTKAGSWDWNIETGISYWSDNCFKIHELNKDDGVPDFTEYLSLVILSDQERISTNIANALNNNGIYDVEYKIITRDSHLVKYLHSFGYVLKDEFNCQHLRGITVDITEKKNEKEEMNKKISDLEKLNKYMIGREERMVELKNEVNELLERLNLPRKYFVHDQFNESEKNTDVS